MRIMILALAPTLALLAPLGAQAEQPAPAIESAAAHPGEPLICQYFYHQGGVVRRPTCKTDREWVRYRLREQADISAFQLRALTGGH